MMRMPFRLLLLQAGLGMSSKGSFIWQKCWSNNNDGEKTGTKDTVGVGAPQYIKVSINVNLFSNRHEWLCLLWHYCFPRIPWTDLTANRTLAWALVALTLGFRTTQDSLHCQSFPFPSHLICQWLPLIHAQGQRAHPGQAVFTGTRSIRSHGVNIPHRTERHRDRILTQNLSFRSEGEHFWIVAKPFPPASGEEQLPQLVLIISPRQLAVEEIASIDGRKTWNCAESCQIVSLARHAKSVGWERGLALHFHNATHRICWSILPWSLWKHGPGSCREEP